MFFKRTYGNYLKLVAKAIDYLVVYDLEHPEWY